MASLANNERASLKVFGIPELALLIVIHIHKHDAVNLMRVCRQLFYSMLPFVWEEVDQVNPLVSLIPGGGIITYGSELSPYVVMHLPNSLELSRFNVYAPHIKRFTPSSICIDEYQGWQEFLSCVRSVDLLPNLETLRLPVPDNTPYTPSPRNIEEDAINWITAFLSTSLQTLELVPPGVADSDWRTHWFTYWLDLGLANRLMECVSQKCPRLRSLTILPAILEPSSSAPWVSQFDPRVSLSCDSPDLGSKLLHLNLTSLLISPIVLNSTVLTSLSKLPSLSSLCVLGTQGDNTTYCNDLDIPTGAFPALDDLQLRRLTGGTVANLCKSKPLVTRLHSLALSNPHPSNLVRIAHEGIRLSDIIPLLSTNCSNLATLTLYNFMDSRPSAESLKSWEHLRIVSLDIGRTLTSSWRFDTLCSVLGRLPLLEDLKLEIDRPSFELKQLRAIVEHVPRLRRIRIPVKWGFIVKLAGETFMPCRSQSNDPLCITSDFYLPALEAQEGAERLARYLSVLRPGAPVVCEAYRGHFYRRRSHPIYIDERPKDIINLELSRLYQK